MGADESTERPFLPAGEPIDSVPKRRTGRIVLLWLLLIFLFVSIYQLFTGPSPTPHTDAEIARHAASCPHASEEQDLWTLLLGSWLPMLGNIAIWFIFASAFIRWRLRGGARLNRKLEPGELALADGDFVGAAEIFRQIGSKLWMQRPFRAHVGLALAEAQLRQGDFDATIATLRRVERTPGLVLPSEWRLRAAIELAVVYALCGEVDVAQRWLADSRRRLAHAPVRRDVYGALLRVAEALTLYRAGQGSEAVRTLERDWWRLDAVLPALTMRRVWLLRAFVASTDPTRSDAERFLSLLRAGRSGELDFMGKKWPELQAFLVAHDLSNKI